MINPTLAVLGGVCVAAQIAMNGYTRTALGGALWAALINNAVGLLGLGLALVSTGARPPDATALRDVPALYWCAGLLGAAFITMSAFVGPRLGLASTFALVLAGQLATALLIDQFGWLGGTPHPASTASLLGVALVFFGALLVVNAR